MFWPRANHASRERKNRVIEVLFWRRALAPSVVHGINFVMNFVSGMSARAQFCAEFHISNLSRDQFCDDFCIPDFGPGSILWWVLFLSQTILWWILYPNFGRGSILWWISYWRSLSRLNFVMNFILVISLGINFVMNFVSGISAGAQFCDEFHIGDFSRDQFCDEFRIRDFGSGLIVWWFLYSRSLSGFVLWWILWSRFFSGFVFSVRNRNAEKKNRTARQKSKYYSF